MLAEVLTVLNIAKAAIDIWDRVRPAEQAREARAVAQAAERQAAAASDPQGVVRTLRAEAERQMSPQAAEDLVTDIRMMWILDVVRDHLKRARGWTIIEEPAFLLAAEKAEMMGSLLTGHHLVGFSAGPRTAAGVDAEFTRWADWVAARGGKPEALLVFVYDDLAGVDLPHILDERRAGGWLRGGPVSAGVLDLSRMGFETRKGFLDQYTSAYGVPGFWEQEFAGALDALREHYVAVSGYFR